MKEHAPHGFVKDEDFRHYGQFIYRDHASCGHLYSPYGMTTPYGNQADIIAMNYLRMTWPIAPPTPEPMVIQRPFASTADLPAHLATFNVNNRITNAPDISMKLLNRDLWSKFHKHCTEMIITKTGRHLYPGLTLKIGGLKPERRYIVGVQMVLQSQQRLKYVGKDNSSGRSGWTNATPSEQRANESYDRQDEWATQLYMHPDSTSTGEYWMRNTVQFKYLKVTNNASDDGTSNGHIVLKSMHKYKPRIWLIESDDTKNYYEKPSIYFEFDETEFIAVTAYQNDVITKLKIDNNPFAKGFRSTKKVGEKRKLEHVGKADQEMEIGNESICNGDNSSLFDCTKKRMRDYPKSNNDDDRRCINSRVSNLYIGANSSGDDYSVATSDSNSDRSDSPPPRESCDADPVYVERNDEPTCFHRPWIDRI